MKWTANYIFVKRFIEKNNHYPSQYSKDKEEKKLYKWCEYQKQAKKGNSKGEITPKRIFFLEQLPNWSWAKDVIPWEDNYNSVKEFVEENNKYPSYCSGNAEEKYLYNWIIRQKQAKKGQGGFKITEERICLLEKLSNFKW